MFKNIIKPTIVLCIICVVVSGLLAFTYNAAGISELGTGLSSEQLNEFMPQVLPSGTKLSSVKVSFEDTSLLSVYKDEGGAGSAVFITADGYGGKQTLKMLVGFDSNGAVAGVAVVENAETPGVGSKALTSEFLSNFVGITEPITVDKNGADVDAIGGATISSKAVGTAVAAAIDMYNNVKGEL